ncbi:ABC transporter permease subunit [Saccharibacillus sp. CPCC 101409]|uniref:ABC transporter permease n=1 Tax=Saccharibacillus sp. CPCC 101409 TaxID=3058041 RepID=UPI002673134C|nr:ABC transporter permease subunit [Saccharibacillus sp. CPCC 101409]MDO3411949.1 ABC transporter permease subunit [Saccharibacillus sp. CPCC 101409]
MKKKKKGSMLRELRQNGSAYLLVIPAALYTLVFGYFTLPYMLIAFQKFNFKTGIFNSPWVGLDNFEFFFSSPRAWEVTFNTLKLNFLFIVVGTLAAMALAILFNELRSKLYSRLTQSTILFPHFLSWVIVSYILYSLLSTDYGMINQLLERLHITPINWYSSPQYWTTILVITAVWKDIGMNLVIYLAAITGIDDSYYEAGRIDGATRWQLIRHITIPLMMPTIMILSLLALGKIMYGSFDMIYAIIKDNGLLYPTVDVIDTYVFRSLRTIGNPAQAMAVGLYQSVVGFILVWGSNKIVRKVNPDHALF